MNCLALDLGTTTGWAAKNQGILTSGTVSMKTGRFEGGGMRFLRFQKHLEELFNLIDPKVVWFEEVRRHIGTDAAHIYGGLQAVLTKLCEERNIPYQGIPVGTVKKMATGKGNANKEKMMEATRQKWPGRQFADDNEADALWILETGLASL